MVSNHKRDEQVHRDEHNDVALAKRSLGVGFDYKEGEYKVIGVDSDGNATVKDRYSLDVEQRLKEIELLLRTLVIHAELITDTFLKEEDLK